MTDERDDAVAPWRAMAQGAAVPALITAAVFSVGLFVSLSSGEDRSWADHVVEAYGFVVLGFLLAAFGGSLSLTMLISGVNTTAGRWRFLGGVVGLILIGALVWALFKSGYDPR